MKKRYTLTLAVIVLLLTVTLSISTSYGLWKVTSGNKNINILETECFEIINNGESINLKEIQPLNIDSGKSSKPISFSVKNNCSVEKNVEVSLNILDSSTLDLKGLTVFAQGNIDVYPTKFSELKNSRNRDEHIIASKIISNASIKPGATVRANLKIWFDDKSVANIDQELELNASIGIRDQDDIVIPTFKETLLENNGGAELIANKALPSFDNVDSSDGGLYLTVDDDGASYYFRGNVSNNYVMFADKLWRVVRVNGDESIRLILNETVSDGQFNTSSNSHQFTGLTYTNDQDKINSKMKDLLDEWYTENLGDSKDSNYITISRFCNDTTNYMNGYHFYYSGVSRLSDNKTPTLMCPETTEYYGGNYRQKIGLITADEASFAGLVYDIDNGSNYLNNGTDYYTLTPYDYYYYATHMMMISSSGKITSIQTNSNKGIRPVISLKSTTVVVGDGTIDNPYKIEE